ncbi:MAG TPA: type II secretion system minor pseudopilin GspI [Steroidobacteraceae bacterium]|nr:type II secretion system minor pseudopilin GspI [Steroidobacteraceae bacterium]
MSAGSARGRARGSPAGFTLIEVLVALAIVAFGMGALLATLTSSASSVTTLREKTFAEWVGLNQLSTARLQTTDLSDGTTTGEIDMAGGSWHWSQEISDLDVPGVKRITVKVRRADTNGKTTPDEKAYWPATVVGFRGDSLARATGERPNWNGVSFSP